MKLPWLVIFAATVAHADGTDPIRASSSAAEKQLLDELDKEQYIKARDHAETILADHPNSFVATWAMARIQHDEEGNHARALYYVRRAEDLLRDSYANPKEWAKQVILEDYWINEEMDRSADALEVLDRYEAKYGRGMDWLRIWPTFKLGRMDEARAIGRKLASSDDPFEREHGYNGMLALEFEAHDRAATYKWATEGVEASAGRSCILLRNASGVAFTRFRLREAEDLGLRANKAADQDCDGAGYDQLAGLYLVEGEFQKSIAALKSFKATPVPKRYRPHYALARRALLADILFALGKTDEAERLAAEVYALPERTGMTSGSKQITGFVRAFRFWMALDARIAREDEKSASRSFLSSLSTDKVVLDVTRWTIRRAIVQLVDNDEFLVSITRPNLGELFQYGAWHTMSLVDVLGTGVMRDAVAAARKIDAPFPESEAYLDLYDAEILAKRGELQSALRLATDALPKLVKEESMLRWRTLAWEAEALRRLGKLEAARPLYQEVLQKAPSMVRIVDGTVPIETKSDGSDLADVALRRIGKSPRFDAVDGAPFRVSASTLKDGSVELCLTDDGGFSFACAHGDKKSTDDDTVVSALDAFHEAAFSPKVALEQTDLNSLDGSPVRASSDQVLKGILEQ